VILVAWFEQLVYYLCAFPVFMGLNILYAVMTNHKLNIHLIQEVLKHPMENKYIERDFKVLKVVNICFYVMKNLLPSSSFTLS
jgi:hypothetical protein